MNNIIKNQHVRNIFWMYFNSIVSKGGVFFVGIILSRRLSPDDFASYAFISSIIVYATNIGSIGIGQYFLKKISYIKDGSLQLLYAVLCSIVAVVAAVVFFIYIKVSISVRYNYHESIVYISAFAVLFSILGVQIQYYAIAAGKFAASNSLPIVYGFVMIAFALYSGFFNQVSVMFVGQLVAFLLSFVAVIKAIDGTEISKCKIKISVKTIICETKFVYREVKFIYLSNLLVSATNSLILMRVVDLDKKIISVIFISQQFKNLLLILPNNISDYYLQNKSREPRGIESGWNKFARVLLVNACGSGLAFIVMAFLASSILKIYSIDLDGGVRIMIFILLSAVPNSISLIFNKEMFARGLAKYNVYSDVAWSVAFVLSCNLLMARMGVEGYVVSMIAAGIVQIGVQFLLLKGINDGI